MLDPFDLRSGQAVERFFCEIRRQRAPYRRSRVVGHYFNWIAGRRLSVLLVGSTMIPSDARAGTPGTGSAPGLAKLTRPAVVSPMNSIRTRPKGYSRTVPSANSYAIFPSCLMPSFSSSSEGAIESVAPVSTRNSDSNDRFGSTRLVSLVVTLVNPMAQRVPLGSTHRNGSARFGDTVTDVRSTGVRGAASCGPTPLSVIGPAGSSVSRGSGRLYFRARLPACRRWLIPTKILQARFLKVSTTK